MSTATLPQLNLRRNEIAFALNVCLNEVDRLIKAKAFPSFKIGGQRLARFEDVKAYNDSLAEGARCDEPTGIAKADQPVAVSATDATATAATSIGGT